uniref:SET domain-containing protein n=1 Tax=Strongyloides stercoralis TaxID=6248 RepID=A0A0K0EG12_STRER
MDSTRNIPSDLMTSQIENSLTKFRYFHKKIDDVLKKARNREKLLPDDIKCIQMYGNAIYHRDCLLTRGKNRFGDYVVEICNKIETDVIYSDHQIENICYTYLPIKTKNGDIMFIDNDNYAYYY